jgi:hypothetical protein
VAIFRTKLLALAVAFWEMRNRAACWVACSLQKNMVIMCLVILKIHADILFYKVDVILHSYAINLLLSFLYFVITLNNYCYFKLLLSPH